MSGESITKEELVSLVERVRGGENEAFSELNAIYGKDLENFISGTVHSKYSYLHQRTDIGQFTRDVIQEVWASFIYRLRIPADQGGYDPAKITSPASLLAWMKTFIVLPKIHELRRQLIRSIPQGSEVEKEALDENLPEREDLNPEQMMLIEEEMLRLVKAYDQLIHITFLCGGYPHQQLAFAFSKLIYGVESSRGLEGKPQRIDELHGTASLLDLSREFCRAFAERSQFNQDDIDGYMEPLKLRLPFKIAELMALDHASLEQFKDMLEELAESTCLRDYYSKASKGYTSSIPDWSYKVEKRVRDVLGISRDEETSEGRFDPRSCSRCKLRHLPPCEKASMR